MAGRRAAPIAASYVFVTPTLKPGDFGSVAIGEQVLASLEKHVLSATETPEGEPRTTGGSQKLICLGKAYGASKVKLKAVMVVLLQNTQAIECFRWFASGLTQADKDTALNLLLNGSEADDDKAAATYTRGRERFAGLVPFADADRRINTLALVDGTRRTLVRPAHSHAHHRCAATRTEQPHTHRPPVAPPLPHRSLYCLCHRRSLCHVCSLCRRRSVCHVCCLCCRRSVCHICCCRRRRPAAACS